LRHLYAATFRPVVVIGGRNRTKLVLGGEVFEASLVDFSSNLLKLILALESKLTVIKLLVEFRHYKVL
jgi:hypothetical protein